MMMLVMFATAMMVLLTVAMLLQEKAATPVDISYKKDDIVSDVLVLDRHAPVGTLSNDDGRLYQLYARPSRTHRDRFHYHCLADDSRIPVELLFKGRQCENDRVGCERVFSGDEMTAAEFGTSAPLRVQLYNEN